MCVGGYPDVIVFSELPVVAEERNDMVANAAGVAAVLSESTEAWGRGGKFRLC
jgi:hypothetical protein